MSESIKQYYYKGKNVFLENNATPFFTTDFNKKKPTYYHIYFLIFLFFLFIFVLFS